MSDPPFDLAGPLPGPGLTVLEASAGTGKTHTLTSLAARYVAEGHPLAEILAVTFTRAATGELRERTRERIIGVADGLRRRRVGAGDGGDAVVAALAAAGPEALDLRLQRLDDAVASFDAATIVTTHGFCQLVLDGLGTAGDVVAGTTLLEDPTDLVDEVIDDLYLRQVISRQASPGFAASQARRAVLRTVGDAALEVRPCGQGDVGSRLGQLADFARFEVTQRLARADQVTYDRLLSRLRATLADGARGPAACQRLRDRWRVVLVDEFQDTDPVQWEILDAAFGGGATTLVLVGDPKQAIYSFRGADVHAYLAARRRATSRFTLATNWRSDAPLLQALEGLLNPLQLGHPDITFAGVSACADHGGAGLRTVPSTPLAPVRVRVVADRQAGIAPTRAGGKHEKASLTAFVAGDVAADIARLLAEGAAEVRDPTTTTWRPVEPRDVAVLTRRNSQAIVVRDALRDVGVPAVVTGLDSVFATRAALEWLRLLDGLVEPSSRAAAAGVALGPWVGWSARRVATAPEVEWDALHATLHRWAATLTSSGVAAVHHSITVETDVPARTLAVPGGERLLTDLAHLAQLLHARAAGTPSGRPGIAALRAWLAARMANTHEAVDVDERSRRLDSDAEAVTVSTVHAAKGLEWGVVYCPFLWDVMRTPYANEPVVYHDGDRRVLDPGLFDGDAHRPDREAARRSALAEARGEDLRLLYVALTRARHQVVLTWGRGHDSRFSSLGRLLVSRDGASGELRPPSSREPTQKQVTDELARLAARAAGRIVVEDASGDRPPGGASAVVAGEAPLAAAAFTRRLDRAWRRASYTSITAAAHGRPLARVASEPEEPGTGDEPEVADAPAPPPAEHDGDVASPWVQVRAGAEVGTTVHRVLELLDFTAPDLPGAIGAALDRVPGAAGLAGIGPALAATLTTPLGPLLDGVPLTAIDRRDRLDEMSFELPVAGGAEPTGLVRTGALAEVVGRHLGAAGPLAGYADRLADPLLATTLRGYLTGSLDLVVRRRGVDGDRFVVADYKTNRIVAADHAATATDYRVEVLDAEMQRQHYPLQALLYTVALHRYLRWRLAGYDPAVHLGGVAYLFVRGMVGPATPVVDGSPCGVFAWRPPTALVTDLDALLATGEVA